MKSRKVQLFSVIVKLFVIVKQYRIFADYHGFAFLVFMVSFVLEMASAIDLYLLIELNYERHHILEIKLVDSHNFTRDSLKGFRRYQEVKNVYRLQNGNLTVVYNPFTEDWDAARLIEKAEEILSGRYVTYCAYEGNHVVGEIMLIPKLNKGRLIIDSFHVSGDYRRRGIGRALFEAARQEALKKGAHALYASCCSSEETINFYSALGFRLSSDPIPSLAEAEPYDLQMECMIVRERQ